MRERPPAVEWRDLTGTPPLFALMELMLPLPWLLLSWALYASPLWWLGPLATFLFFLCALRLNHEAIHGNLGLPPWAHRAVLHALSVLMLGSNHAVAFGHLQHHRTPLGEEDHEGACGRMTLGQVLRYGPLFPWHLNAVAWRHGGPRWRRRLLWDAALVAAWLALVAVLGQRFLWWHVAMTALGQCCTAFFAVWITHHDVADGIVARSQRGPLAVLAYEMFYHREHHLFPQVPVRNLPSLARRLDEGVPGYAASRRPVVAALEPAALRPWPEPATPGP